MKKKTEIEEIVFLDIPILEEIFSLEEEEIVKRRRLAQDCINLKKNVRKPLQRKKQQFSRGILCIASYLKKYGGLGSKYVSYKVFISANFEDFSSAKCFCITGNNTAYFGVACQLAKIIKQNWPTKKVVIGGFHVTALDRESLEECEFIDFVIKGPGAKPLLELINADFNPIGIKGITYRNPINGEIIQNPAAEITREELISPDYSILPFPLSSYNFNIQSSLGCSGRCHFCANGFFWKNVYHYEIENIISELDLLNKELEPETVVHLSDNCFGSNYERTDKFLDLIIDKNYKIKLSCDFRADHLMENLVIKMSRAGFVKISFGFEDAVAGCLNQACKPFEFEKNVLAAQSVKKNSDILVEAYWLMGLPGSTNETLQGNISRISKLILEDTIDVVGESIVFTPLPGTPFYHQADKYLIKIYKLPWISFLRSNFFPVYELPDVSREDLYKAFIQAEQVILDAYCHKLGCAPEGLENLFGKLENEMNKTF